MTTEPTNEGIQTSGNTERYKKSGITIERDKSLTKHGAVRKFTCRIKFRKKVHFLTLAETADESFKMAVRARREIHEGRYAEFKAKTALRTQQENTVGQVFAVYRLFKGAD